VEYPRKYGNLKATMMVVSKESMCCGLVAEVCFPEEALGSSISYLIQNCNGAHPASPSTDLLNNGSFNIKLITHLHLVLRFLVTNA
jgi:hypothetical protein